MDDTFFEDSWNNSLRDDLLPVDYPTGPSWNSILSGFMSDPPLPRTLTSHSHNPSRLPNPPQLPQIYDTQNTTPSNYHHPSSTSSNQRRSHLDLPNFPLQSDPIGTPSNTSGRPLAPSNLSPVHTIPHIQDHPHHHLRSASPLSEDTFPSSPESSYSSTRSDTPFPQAENPTEFVDLTQDPSPPIMSPAARPLRTQKRRSAMSPRTAASLSSRATSAAPSNPSKRRKTEASQSSHHSAKIEEIDLRDADDDSGLSKVLEQQRMATIKAQQEQASKPVKLSTLQCIICMENMKDLTATHCGHLFCHACLMEALIAGENQGSEPGKGTPKCPVCRKKVVRPSGNSDRQKKDSLHVVPLAIKVKVRSNIAKGKARAL